MSKTPEEIQQEIKKKLKEAGLLDPETGEMKPMSEIIKASAKMAGQSQKQQEKAQKSPEKTKGEEKAKKAQASTWAPAASPADKAFEEENRKLLEISDRLRALDEGVAPLINDCHSTLPSAILSLVKQQDSVMKKIQV
nr:hypothetical protein [Candidatus Sigynarchaeota archaeon]